MVDDLSTRPTKQEWSAKLAKAMELLAEYGRVVIKSIKGRRVIADWPKEGEE